MSVQYNTLNLTYDEKHNVLRDAWIACDKWWMDKLDGSISFSRQKVLCNFHDAMSHLNKNTLITIINRTYMEDHFEFGFRTMTSPDYFLWIIVDANIGKYIASSYNIEVLSK